MKSGYKPKFSREWPSWQQFTNPAMLRVVAKQRNELLQSHENQAKIIQSQVRRYLQRKKYIRALHGFKRFKHLASSRIAKIIYIRKCSERIVRLLGKNVKRNIHSRKMYNDLLCRSTIIIQSMYRCHKSRRIYGTLKWSYLHNLLLRTLVPLIIRRQSHVLYSQQLAIDTMKGINRKCLKKVLPRLSKKKQKLKRIVNLIASHEWLNIIKYIDLNVIPALSMQRNACIRIIKWYRFHKIRKFHFLKNRQHLHAAAMIVQKRWKKLQFKKRIATAKVLNMINKHKKLVLKKKRKLLRKDKKKKIKLLHRQIQLKEEMKQLKHHDKSSIKKMLKTIKVSSASSSSDTDDDNASDAVAADADAADAESNNGKKRRTETYEIIEQDFKIKKYILTLVTTRIQRQWKVYTLRKVIRYRIEYRKATMIQNWYIAVRHNITFKRHLFLRIRLRKLEYEEWLVLQNELKLQEEYAYNLLRYEKIIICQQIYQFYRNKLNEENRIWFSRAANEVSNTNVTRSRIHTLKNMERERIRRLREDAASVIIQAYWRRTMSQRIYINRLMHRDKCAVLIQSHWRRNMGYKKSCEMADYWNRMLEWTKEQEFNQTPEGRAKLIKSRIIQESIRKREKRRNRQNINQAISSKSSSSPSKEMKKLEPIRASLAAKIQASIASTKIFTKAKLSKTFHFMNKRNTNEASIIKLKRLKKQNLKKSHQNQHRVSMEIFRDDELLVGDTILVKWRNGRVGWPAKIVGIHHQNFVSQFTGKYVGHKLRTFDVIYQEDKLMDYRVPMELIAEVLTWKDEATKKKKKIELEKFYNEKNYNKVKNSKKPGVASKAKLVLERSIRALESAIQNEEVALKKQFDEYNIERVGYETPDIRLADLMLTTKGQKKHSRRERSIFSRRKHEKSQLAVQRTAKTSLGMRTGCIEMKIVVGESELNDFQNRLMIKKKKLLQKGVKLEDIQTYYECHKHDLRLRKRREAGDRLPVYIYVKKGPALRHMIELRCSRGWARHSHECERFRSKDAKEKLAVRARAMANIALEEDGLDNDGTSLNVSTGVDSSSSNNKEDDRVDMSMRWNECIPNRAKPSELPQHGDGASGSMATLNALKGGNDTSTLRFTNPKRLAPGPPGHWDRLPLVMWTRTDSVKRPIADVKISSVRLGSKNPRSQEIKLFKLGYLRLPEDLFMMGCDRGTYVWIKYREDTAKQEEDIVTRIARLQNLSHRPSVTTKKILLEQDGGGVSVGKKKDSKNSKMNSIREEIKEESEIKDGDEKKDDDEKEDGDDKKDGDDDGEEEEQVQLPLTASSVRLWSMVNELALDDIEVLEFKLLYNTVDQFNNGYIDLEDMVRYAGFAVNDFPNMLQYFVAMACPDCEDHLGIPFHKSKPGKGGYFIGRSKLRRLSGKIF
jgi:hypothetical protein